VSDVTFLKYNGKNAGNDDRSDIVDQLFTILETVIVTFAVTFIPYLIELGRPPANLSEVWVPLCSSMLAGVYAYIRVRGISESEKKT
jgi:hypothetical protein